MVAEEMLVWAAETGCVLQLGVMAVSSGSSAGLLRGRVQERWLSLRELPSQNPDTRSLELISSYL